MSAPRYLNQIKEEFGESHYLVCKEIFINGSQSKQELAQRLSDRYKKEIGNAIPDLLQAHYLVGVQSLIADPTAKKREIKAADKVDSAVRLNFFKFMAEDRKRAVIKMAQRKLHNATDELPLKLLMAMTEMDKESAYA